MPNTPNVKLRLHGHHYIQIPFNKLEVGETIACHGFPSFALHQAVGAAHRRSLKRYELISMNTGYDFYITRIA